MRSEDFPEPPCFDYYVVFSCLHQMTSEWQMGRKSSGLYFDALIKVFNDSLRRPAIERHKLWVMYDEESLCYFDCL